MIERNKVVLVNEQDDPIGEMEKMEAHVKGELHRAFSVFVFNDKGKMLLQQRAINKYHGGGLWTNACCSHPQLGEHVIDAASERLKFEMGLNCNLSFLYSFLYKAEVENNLIVHELDHVFIGQTNNQPCPNEMEVENYKWISVDCLKKDVEKNPDRYTYWFTAALPKVLNNLKTNT